MKCGDHDSLYWIFSQVIRFHYYRVHMLLEKVGIYPGQPPLLFFLERKAGQSQRELAEKLNIKPATIAIMLKRMEKSGLVERRPDSADQRILRVYLTDKGRILRNEAAEAFKKIDGECFKNFTLEEQLLLRRLLMQMRNNLMEACGKNLE